MFNSNKNNTTQRTVTENHGNQPVINIISEGTVINGEIITENDFRISGKVVGKLEVKGKCIVTNSGVINGDLRAKDADISGKTEGNLIVGNKLFLRQTARVSGDIHTKTLLIEEGAIFEGSCHMSKDPLTEEKSSAKSTEKKNNNGTTEVAYKPGFKLDQVES
jgi:cytoskeletal protein CcmA (bactofilin family)